MLNLTTAVTSLSFHPSSEALAFGSQAKKDCLKMLHLPTFEVFPNWPTARTPLHFLSDVAFSPSGAYLAIGNDRGKALLYSLPHFGSR